MVLDEEKALLSEEIVFEKNDDSDPEDEGEQEESPEGGDEDDEEEDEEELEDPGDKVREACAQHKECAKLFEELEACNNRVNSKSNTEEICVQELFDFLECRDKCLAHSLFSKVK